ncbi:MAG: hypothetical protein ISR83_07775 [Candidatus Marinimicrobia bacterium]|nr:hypothetical protein [Candidatus Neomarinimicrobiota bacterium]
MTHSIKILVSMAPSIIAYGYILTANCIERVKSMSTEERKLATIVVIDIFQ